jgi:hypothetical protein
MAWARRKPSRTDQRLWARSNAISAIRVPRVANLTVLALRIADALATGERVRVEAASQALLDAFCRALGVHPLRVAVGGTRPTNDYGELHGLYRPGSGGGRDRVDVWMHTARRGQVVAFKTFLRTLLHELCHHLDYEHLKLSGSPHTEGFYKRESSLVYAALPRSYAGSVPLGTGRAPTPSTPDSQISS